MRTQTPGPPVQCSLSIKGVPKEKLLFESFPREISEGYTTTYRQSRANRTTQKTAAYYQGGDFTGFNVTLEFVAGLLKTDAASSFTGDAEKDMETVDLALQEMERKVRWLEALCFPRPKKPRASGYFKNVPEGDPPYVLITLGRFLTIMGKATTFTVTWKGPFHPISARPNSAEVVMAFIRLATYYPDWWDIAKPSGIKAPSVPLGTQTKSTTKPQSKATKSLVATASGNVAEVPMTIYGKAVPF